MKRPFLILCMVFPMLSAQAQCNTFFPIKEDVKFQYDHFDKKDKLSLRTIQWLEDVSGAGNSMKATMVQEMVDVKKDKVIGKSESEWVCEDGTLLFAMNNMQMSGQQMPNANMSMEITGDKMDIPSAFQVGQALKDLTYQIKMSMSGVTMMNRSFDVKDRKVEAQESVTTPAGTFDCYKVSFNTTSEGGIGSGTVKSVIWYAKDVGMVKMENYNEKGQLMSRQVLTKIEK